MTIIMIINCLNNGIFCNCYGIILQNVTAKIQMQIYKLTEQIKIYTIKNMILLGGEYAYKLFECTEK